jgi:Phytanoyl-CoA dioxygenase (PhyH)
MNTVFADAATENEFAANGYVVRPFLQADEIGALRRLYEEFPPEQPSDFYATVFSRNSGYRRHISDGIREVIRTQLDALFPYHEPCFSVFVTKRPKTKHGSLPLHRDYWFADAGKHTAVHLWFPLVNVDETNGCLQVVSGSHTLVESPYAVNEYPPVFGNVMDLLAKKFVKAVPMAAGSVFAYESRLFHGSGENLTDAVRPACVVILLPRGERPRVYVWNKLKPTSFDVLEVTTDFLLEMERGAPIDKPYPAGVSYLASVEYPVDPLRPQDLTRIKPAKNPGWRRWLGWSS